ncbi:glycosyltransferase family 2 protein [Lactiplantibacillus plajomi]|uniref:Glycosyltransferase family 2 protein n=1 Tax=Lactiplantibacillus plajomi TaxID=1457217 RepID=A0ABV6K3I2_9LACO|nr:glycosyltransferase family 2 protein [Lactiplantibacillus plajomi]
MNSLVSVIVPIYNESKYLDSFFSMLDKQTYHKLEVIMIDDGSTDGSLMMLNKKKRDSKYKIIHQENCGVSAARNAGIKHASGKFCVFVDADDQFDDCYIQYLVTAIEKSNAQLVSCGYSEFKINEGEIFRYSQKNSSENLNFAVAKIVTHHEMGSALWNKIFKTEIILKNNLKFSVDIAVGEDLLFVISYLTHVKKWVEIPYVLYHYQLNDFGTMQNYKTAKEFNQNWLTEWKALKLAQIHLASAEKRYVFDENILHAKRLRVAIKLLGRSKQMNYKSKEIFELRQYVRKGLITVLTSKQFPPKQVLKALLVSF